MINEAYVSYEVSKLLKEKGFNEKTFTFYIKGQPYNLQHNFRGNKFSNSEMENGYSSPTHQMACAWLREKGIYITIIYGDYPANKKVFWTPQIDSLEGFDLPDSFYQEYDLYEDAVEAALKYCLENLI